MIRVVLYTIPQAACDSNKMNWQDVAKFIEKQVCSDFGESISFKHIEFMSKEWFSDLNPQTLLENGAVSFPFVLVNEEIACSEAKVNLSKIKRSIRQKLQL